MNDQNLIAIASNLSVASSDILTYLELKEGQSIRLSDLYLYMLQQGVGMQKTPEEVESLSLSLMVRTDTDKTDKRSKLVGITEYGKRLMDLGRNIDMVTDLYPDPVLQEDTLLKIKVELQGDHRKILEAIRDEEGFDSIKELYQKVTKGKVAYRIFQSRVAALKTALLLDVESIGVRKIPVLTSNATRLLEM